MVNLEKALIKDAKMLLAVQKKCFENYSIKYGDFESNPYHMTLHRMEFNLKYKYNIIFHTIPVENLAIFLHEIPQLCQLCLVGVLVHELEFVIRLSPRNFIDKHHFARLTISVATRIYII